MNKLKLISKISEELGVKKDQIETFLISLNKIVVESLKEEKENNPDAKVIKVIVGDLGAVHLKHRKERICKVPKSEKVLTIPAQDVPVFKISKKVKDSFK
ncbi:MAG: HU family DNA-binding protein [Phytoplasma sp.]|uniref:HU family DNA-binding protein n=1 Tax=Phytoplasma sp. TaxID=2155 RepID=UPI002B40F448|nr:HU family DNA-binding protein [Phytoplasma sp.]WRH06536.1 MAG: HU family DNA-binding protein [Phytoplasma sp.]